MATPPVEHIGPPSTDQPWGLWTDLKLAVRDSGSVGLGAFPMGVAFGILVTHSGLQWWWASVISGFIYAGSLEFLFLGLVLSAAPLASVALTAFLVNFRHVFYALSFPLYRVQGRLGKTYSTFALSDEAYAVTVSETAHAYPSRRILWLQVFIHLYWVGGSTTGALLGSVVPGQVVGLDFAVTALFTVLALDAFRASHDIPLPVLALACALVGRFVFPGQMLLTAFLMFAVGLTVRYAWKRKGHAHA
ncbi:AzlC family ABC transporter permease [Streptomyces sp. NPDC002845]